MKTDPFEKVEGTDFYRFNSEKYLASISPPARRNHERSLKVFKIALSLHKKLPWMSWPFLNVIYTFWHMILEEGVKSNIESKFDGIQFSYLNDGYKPTVWHTLRQITHTQNDSYTGIYPEGAPKSLAQAQEWEADYERKRKEKENAS